MKNGKVVIIGGNAKSGKTTVSNQLAMHGFYQISLKSYYSIIESTFGVSFDQLSDDKKFQFLEYIVNQALQNAKNGNFIVIDMDDFLPQDIAQLEHCDQLQIYFLAYPNCSVQEIKKNIKNYADSADWIMQINDSYLDTCVTWFDEKNRLLVDECGVTHMKMIDTSCGEKRAEILDDLVQKILN